MNEIVTTQDDRATLVDIRKNPERYPRICKTPLAESIQILKNIIYSAHLLTGRTITPEILQFTAENLYQVLMDDEDGVGTRNLSWLEITRGVKRGVLGQEKMYGISVATLYDIIVKYIKDFVAPAHKTAMLESKQQQHTDIENIVERYSKMMQKAAQEREKEQTTK